MSDRPSAIPLAAALHYEKPGVPKLVAKGKGVTGEQIIEAARAHGVPIEENAALAAALAEIDLGEEIPVELYKAVAEVLSFILRLSDHHVRTPTT